MIAIKKEKCTILKAENDEIITDNEIYGTTIYTKTPENFYTITSTEFDKIISEASEE